MRYFYILVDFFISPYFIIISLTEFILDEFFGVFDISFLLVFVSLLIFFEL